MGCDWIKDSPMSDAYVGKILPGSFICILEKRKFSQDPKICILKKQVGGENLEKNGCENGGKMAKKLGNKMRRVDVKLGDCVCERKN